MAVTTRRAVRAGKPYPLGATWDGRGVNFALFSANAEKVELCLFNETGRRELERATLPEYTDQVWHGYLAGARAGLIYGYRVYGPYHPERGHRFNPNKLLIDPYAVALLGELQPNEANFGFRAGDPRADPGDADAPCETSPVWLSPDYHKALRERLVYQLQAGNKIQTKKLLFLK